MKNRRNQSAHNMSITSLTAISPVDGATVQKQNRIRPIFPNLRFIRFVYSPKWNILLHFCELPLKQLESVPSNILPKLREIYGHFSLEDAEKSRK